MNKDLAWQLSKRTGGLACPGVKKRGLALALSRDLQNIWSCETVNVVTNLVADYCLPFQFRFCKPQVNVKMWFKNLRYMMATCGLCSCRLSDGCNNSII